VSRVSTCIPYRSSRGCTHPSDSDGGRFVKRLTVPDGSPATRYSRSNSHMAAAQFRHCDRRPSNENRTYRERRISVPGRQPPLGIGPYRAPDNRGDDGRPITDGGRVYVGPRTGGGLQQFAGTAARTRAFSSAITSGRGSPDDRSDVPIRSGRDRVMKLVRGGDPIARGARPESRRSDTRPSGRQ
jgi:hypothetical protein